MFRMTPLASAIALIACVGMPVAASEPPAAQPSLLAQAKGLPQEFQEHFFDVPLAVRIVLDNKELGEAMVVLSRDDHVTLLDFTDTRDSDIGPAERDLWRARLQQGVALGACQTACDNGLLAVHYSLQNSELALVTRNVERATAESQFYHLPEQGSTGVMLRNQLNLSGGQDQDMGGRYGLQAIASLGNWTQTANMQANRTGGQYGQTQYALHELHTQTERKGSFVRLGYFMPTAEGLSRQPRTFGASPDTVMGVMLGSSDSLAVEGTKAAVYPLYVTANREAVVEIYRDGVLINTQQVQPGLQTLDTRPLPGGIYDVEVRLLEDGQETSRTDELVYKPNNWRNPDQRWRFNTFLGRETQLLSSWDPQPDAGTTAGAAVNYLLHPRAVVGLSARQVKARNQLGTSLDLGVGSASNLYANLYKTQDHGTGMDVQALHNYGSGNLIASHNRSWLDNRNTYETLIDGTQVRQRYLYNGPVSNSSLALNHRLSSTHSLNARYSYTQGQIQGSAIDLSWLRHGRLFGNAATWQLSVFDRPASISSGNERNRGVDLRVTLAVGGQGKSLNASLGTRTDREGNSDRNASIGYQQQLQSGPLTSVSATATTDTYGIGLSGSGRFHTPLAEGDVFLQRSSYNNALTGALNLTSNLVVGGGKVALTGSSTQQQAGMIIDVESDLDTITLRADDLSGTGTILKPGRNFVPVSAYRDSTVQFDFQGNHAPAANIQPPRARYHLNKGGVAYSKVRVMKTMTVLGRLLDANGRPMKGQHIVNHASRSVTEVDGFFSLEMSEGTPTLEVRKNDQRVCAFTLDPTQLNRENDVLMVGDLRCVTAEVAAATPAVETAG
ncbi:CS1-pili formation C-terminal domain-containing protein [Pseudomonas sp. MWU16-30317]|uniref:CS1-pili formation C-terminal domain-containing protein n=1 Tax=Pseudomonas sp. MWU16-30317 TaxID=2878095 RepID=UPI001CF99233|nr:CS1-pili formation C-terminal domain-containing protein [Pseudomonas sp. MWU16-30317]